MRKPRKKPAISVDKIEYKLILPRKKNLLEVAEEFPDYEFKSISAAKIVGVKEGIDFIEERASSWEGYYFPYVTLRDTDDLKTPKIIDLKEKIEKEKDNLRKALEATDVSNLQAKLITCRSCESKINKNYINNSICPVCESDMRAKSAFEAIKRKKEKIEKLERSLFVEVRKHANEAPLKYLVAVPTH